MQLKEAGGKALAIDSDNVEVRPARHEQSGIGIAFDVVASGIGIIFRPLSKIEEKLPVWRVGMVRSQVILDPEVLSWKLASFRGVDSLPIFSINSLPDRDFVAFGTIVVANQIFSRG